MLTLLMLQEGDIYGYQLIQMLAERSGDRITVQEGSLYPLLYRMQDGNIERSVEVNVSEDATHIRRITGRYRYHPERAQAQPGAVPSGTQRTGAADRAKGGI